MLQWIQGRKQPFCPGWANIYNFHRFILYSNYYLTIQSWSCYIQMFSSSHTFHCIVSLSVISFTPKVIECNCQRQETREIYRDGMWAYLYSWWAFFTYYNLRDIWMRWLNINSHKKLDWRTTATWNLQRYVCLERSNLMLHFLKCHRKERIWSEAQKYVTEESAV